MFIHGLGGDAFKTWSNDKDHTKSWPFWLGEAFPNVGVWSIGYASSPSKLTRVLGWFSAKHEDAGQTMPLPDRGLQLLNQLQQRGIGQRSILFICHSLGGLVAKQILRSSADATGDGLRETALREVAANTRGVLFLATPHNGAALASMLNAFRTVLGTTVSITDLKLHDAHLRELFNWYRNHSQRLQIETITYYEGRRVRGALPIVNETSSHPGVGADPLMLDEDHLSIAKPSSTDTDVYLGACSLLRDCVLRQLPRHSNASTAAAPVSNPSPPITVYVDSKLFGNASPARIPHQLPPAAEQYFGRSVEKAKVIARLREGKNTTIVAPAGLGKTALAAEAVRAVVGTIDAPLATSPYPDGVVFLDLYEFHGNLDRAMHSLATTLMGEDFMEQAQPHDRAAAACRGKRILVIIEGGEEADGIGNHGQITDLFRSLSPENRRLLLTRLSTQSAVAESISLKDALDEPDAAALLDSLTQGRVTAKVRTGVLTLLEGHPLAITWAGNLLARGDESPERLATDWAMETLPTLSDPEKATRTLEWLFNRSVRGLDDTARPVLAVAGLLARAPFPLAAMVAALGDDASEKICRDALKTLVQRGLLQLTGEADHWQFTHVLGYRFARDENGSEASIRLALASWLDAHLKDMLTPDKAVQTESQVARCLEHVGALLRADFDQTLWLPLANEVLYDVSERLTVLGRLGRVAAALAEVELWLNQAPLAEQRPTGLLRERSVVFNKQGDVRRAQGDHTGALKAFQAAMIASEELVVIDPSNAVWRHDLSMSLNNVGNMRQALGDPAGARDAFLASLNAVETLVANDPSNVLWQRDLSSCRNSIGQLRCEMHDAIGALVDFRVAARIVHALAANDPSDNGWQRDLSVCQCNMAKAFRMHGDLPNALFALRAAKDVAEELAASDPSNATWQHDLSSVLGCVAQVLEQQSEQVQALEYAEKSLQIGERLAALDQSNTMWQKDVEVSRMMVARLKAAAD